MWKNGKWPKTVKKVESKLGGPSMLRNIIGPSFDLKNGNVCLLQKKDLLPAERRIFLKKNRKGGNKKKQRKLGPTFDSIKIIFGPSFDSTT